MLALDARGDDLVIGRLAIPASCSMRSISKISERSMHGSHVHRLRGGDRESRRWPQAIIAAAIGKRMQSQPQSIWRRDRGRPRSLTAPRQDIEDHVRAVRATIPRLGTGRLDRNQAIAQHRGQQIDHLPVAVLHALELAAHAPKRAGQFPPFERRPIAKGAGFSRKNRDVSRQRRAFSATPRIVDPLVTSKRALRSERLS